MAIPDDLTEIGPDGEEWWLICPYHIKTGDIPAGFFTPFFFGTLREVMKAIEGWNHERARTRASFRYRASLAVGKKVIPPTAKSISDVHTWGKSRYAPSYRRMRGG